MWLNFPNPVAVADGKEVEAKKVKEAIYKAHQQEIQYYNQWYLRRDGKESL